MWFQVWPVTVATGGQGKGRSQYLSEVSSGADAPCAFSFDFATNVVG